jgi:hypothetical protein
VEEKQGLGFRDWDFTTEDTEVAEDKAYESAQAIFFGKCFGLTIKFELAKTPLWCGVFCCASGLRV